MAGALADVMKDQAAKAQSRREADARRKRGRRNGPGSWITLFVLLAVSGYIWIVSPSWLQSGPAPIPPTLADAGLRVEVYQQAIRIDEFVQENQRLPRDLAELGDEETRVEFTPLSGLEYRLRISGPQGFVEYTSPQDLGGFVGNALQIIRQGG